MNRFLTILIYSTILFSRKKKKTVVPQVEAGNQPKSTMMNPHANMPKSQNPQSTQDFHQFKALETLDTDKYTYIKADENGTEYWVAVQKQNINVGSDYGFKGGLLKKNFESKEYNRIFETLYLVSNLQILTGANNTMSSPHAGISNHEEVEKKEITHRTGDVAFKDLIDNKSKYANKKVQITGQCVKVNPNIMDRNWIHLQDGTADHYDITATTDEIIPVGAVVTLEGTVAINKDFGAGYKYELIIENAILK